jgi:hypothetical protein
MDQMMKVILENVGTLPVSQRRPKKARTNQQLGGGTRPSTRAVPQKCELARSYKDDAAKSLQLKIVGLEQGIQDLKFLLSNHEMEVALLKAKELTGETARLGAIGAMHTCVAIQLVGRQGLTGRCFDLVEDLIGDLKSFKQNLIIDQA